MTVTKITGLTGWNVRAIRETILTDRVEVAATTATFHMDAAEAIRLVQDAMSAYPKAGHPRQSLHAVLRKLVKARQAEVQS